MSRSVLLGVTLLLLSSNALATNLVSTVDTLLDELAATFEGAAKITSSLREGKIVHSARDDLASFVASAGEIRSAKLEAALHYVRSQAAELSTTNDLELATALLAN